MKLLILFLATTCLLPAAIQSDGTGLFPVVVLVMESDGVTPIQGASVKLDGLSEYHETEVDPQKRTRVIPDTLGKASLTDAKGCAVVFFHGRWGSSTQSGTTTYGQSLQGTLVVEAGKRLPFRVKLEDWTKKNGYSPQANGAPFITFVLKYR
ncbi:MAG: hypothetical protein CFE26_12925 [Verrucomicrobiales bacterium VVV1]|nr:MAG: hypothetical protein CFE26_12925 [Verrucomicrobiales bacterium VVV1]